MSFRFQCIAFDLDDTLLLPTHNLSDRARNALIELDRRGCRVVLASGRMLVNMLPVAELLPFAPSVVSFNGALVHENLQSEPIYHLPLPAATAQNVIEWALERDLHLHFYAGNHLFTNRSDDWKARVYREQTGAILEYVADFSQFFGQEPTKMLIVDEPERIEQLLNEGREHFGAQLKLTRSRPIYLEFLHPEVDKGKGVQALCKYLQIDLAHVAAFGDAYNDTEMLQSVGYPVVMENSLEDVKRFGREVCPPNSEDGVAQTLERWLSE